MARNTNLLSLGLEDRDRLNKELGGGIPRGSIVLIEGITARAKAPSPSGSPTGSFRRARRLRCCRRS